MECGGIFGVLINDEPDSVGGGVFGGGAEGETLGEDARVPDGCLVPAHDDGAVGGEVELCTEACGAGRAGAGADGGEPLRGRGGEGECIDRHRYEA